MELPLISVIVPVYKVEKYLDRCVRSLVEQSYQHLEIILVDDGSPDASGAMCDAWAERDSRIRVIHQKNGGLSAARNAGIEASRGDMLCFVDSDDYVSPETYAQLQALLDDGTDIAECGWLKTLDDDAVFTGQRESVLRCNAQQAMELHIWDQKFWQITCNKLYRREVIGDIRFPLGMVNEDEFWTYRVIGRARGLAHTDAALYAYRQQEDSIMHKPYSIRRLGGIQAKRQRLTYLQANMPELLDSAKRELLLACIFTMQGVLRYLKGEERAQALDILSQAAAEARPVKLSSSLSLKKNVLLLLGRLSLAGTGRFLNFLTDIHVFS